MSLVKCQIELILYCMLIAYFAGFFSQTDTIPLTAMVLSAVFWPAFREEKLKVAEEIQRYLVYHKLLYL